ncbi:hypothetical protein OsI_04887 [Oryza sativa Indica Group]|uniref:Uncharacterized protein n=1 Tax=Oryza sativa subsp. indica TaxID=39946 RepID=A2WY83_ORYSI|nr:hypothetical protein OsI_04887 [Oryza sativa Indica Group]
MTGHSKLRAPEHHDHELTLTAGKESFRCDGCKEHGYHMRYVCKLGGCRAGFHLHEACAQHRFGDSYQDPFKRYSLVFHKSLPSTVQDDVRCDGCGGNVNGYAYVRDIGRLRTLLKRGRVLHPCCAALPKVIEAEGSVTKLRLTRKLRSPCCKCRHVKLGDRRHTWGYVSDGGGGAGVVQIHVACANDLFREEYEGARLQQQQRTRVERLKARLVNMLRGAATGGGGGVMILPQLPAGVPEESSPSPWTMDSPVVKALLWTICTVGAVITGNPVGISNFLLTL